MAIRNQVPPTDRMKRPQDKFRDYFVTNQMRQSFAHLTTRLDCECAADDILRAEAMFRRQQVRDACG